MINVQSCKIIPPDTDNVSDHLLLMLTMELYVPLAETPVTIVQLPGKQNPFGNEPSLPRSTGARIWAEREICNASGGSCGSLMTKLKILGVTFTNSGTFSDHVQNRIQKCRTVFYSLINIGMNYPGSNNNSKSHLYTSICLPTLTYCMQCANLSSSDKWTLNSAQDGMIKQMCDLSNLCY